MLSGSWLVVVCREIGPESALLANICNAPGMVYQLSKFREAILPKSLIGPGILSRRAQVWTSHIANQTAFTRSSYASGRSDMFIPNTQKSSVHLFGRGVWAKY